MTDRTLGFAITKKKTLKNLISDFCESNEWKMSELGENGRFSRCSRALLEQEGKRSALATFTERTGGALSSKLVSWSQGWPLGNKRSFCLAPSLLFLSSVSLLTTTFSSPQAYLQVPRAVTQPHCEASLKLIITTVY